jgi:Tryptophan-associated transmembrane protein (Trp_oprn_chp)
MNRRSYFLTLLACLAGAGLSVWSATRTWSLLVETRPGLSDLRTARTGADVEPWLIGLALVALAGTGALLATHGWVRRVLGGLLALAGAGIVAGSIAGRAGLDVGRASGAWPILCAVGGAIVVAGGVTAARLGHRWPGMSSRYERRPAPARETKPGGPSSAAATSLEPADHRAAWEALDRGDDPTAR